MAAQDVTSSPSTLCGSGSLSVPSPLPHASPASPRSDPATPSVDSAPNSTLRFRRIYPLVHRRRIVSRVQRRSTRCSRRSRRRLPRRLSSALIRSHFDPCSCCCYATLLACRTPAEEERQAVILDYQPRSSREPINNLENLESLLSSAPTLPAHRNVAPVHPRHSTSLVPRSFPRLFSKKNQRTARAIPARG